MTAVHAQDPRGTINGQVTDISGALVPNVAVRITNAATSVSASDRSNNQGAYEVPYLNPGIYRVEAEVPGFRKWTQSEITLRTGDRLRLDITLTPGDVKEVVDVTGQAPLLEAATATVSQVITSKQVSEMPLRGGSIAYLFTMAPGVIMTALPYDGPWNVDQSSSISVAGGRGASADFNIDGVTNNGKGGTTAFVPPPDMVQEVRIEANSYDAGVGHTTGGSINVSLKSGTNGLHGTANVSVSSGPMMTRNFFTNKFIFDPTTGPVTPEKIRANTPSARWLRESATIGGPLVLPKLYNGRSKTFWMFGYQSHNRRRAASSLQTVPTEPQRNGDFSALLRVGPQYQLSDPITTAPAAGGRFSRQPLAGNVIPASRIDAAAKNILRYYPAPNNAGTADGLTNYANTRQETQDLYQPVVRIDHNFSDTNRMFARYSHSDFFGHFDQLVPGSEVRGRLRRRPHRGIALDDVIVLSNSLVLDVRYGMTWFQEYQSFDNIGWDLSEFKFPASLIAQFPKEAVSFPQIAVNGLLQLGNDGGFRQPSYNHSMLAVLNWTRGSHSVRFGFDGRMLYDNAYTYGNVSPLMNFDQAFTRGPLDNSPVAPAGQGLASLLFGLPTGGYSDLNASKAERSNFFSPFVQDDWRLSRTLTLNLGVRWEVETPVVERFNRGTRDLNQVTANPIENAARAAYARSPIAEVSAAQFRTPGGVTFLGASGQPRSQRDISYRAVMPRFGFAWSVRPKMVIRGGYGIFFGLIGADFADVAQPGFSQRTNIVATNDNGQSYVASISNPLPNGLEQPRGATAGLSTFLGRSPGFTASDGRRPYTQRWSSSIQWEPLPNTVMEVGYMGTRSTRLRVTTDVNAISQSYLSTSAVRDQPTIDRLSSQVNNPFLGIDGFQGTTYYAARQIGRQQLLRPMPQFNGLTTGLPAGSSWYHALTARFERRFSKGLMLQANYTWSKTLEAVSYLNDWDSRPEHVVSDLDRPHRISMMGMYELPFGRGRQFAGGAKGFVEQVIGGWQMQAMWQQQSGAPLNWGNAIYTGQFTDLRLSGDERKLDRWFNTAGFDRNNLRQLANNIRYMPSRISAVRADGIWVADVSLFKTFRLHERLKLQLRGEAEGVLNHPNFSAPNVGPVSTLFGSVNSTQTGQEERRVFVGLKLLF